MFLVISTHETIREHVPGQDWGPGFDDFPCIIKALDSIARQQERAGGANSCDAAIRRSTRGNWVRNSS